MTTEQSITLKVALDSAQGLQSFLNLSMLARPGVEVTSSQITSVVKGRAWRSAPEHDDHESEMRLLLEEVARNRPYTLSRLFPLLLL
jgi:hypothetical protein